jgi:hypothetical protein
MVLLQLSSTCQHLQQDKRVPPQLQQQLQAAADTPAGTPLPAAAATGDGAAAVAHLPAAAVAMGTSMKMLKNVYHKEKAVRDCQAIVDSMAVWRAHIMKEAVQPPAALISDKEVEWDTEVETDSDSNGSDDERLRVTVTVSQMQQARVLMLHTQQTLCRIQQWQSLTGCPSFTLQQQQPLCC